MKYLKLYENFEKDIKKLCYKYNIENYTINQDGSIDVDSSVDLGDYKLLELPLKFGKVLGYFDCVMNQLTSLKNSPKHVVNSFYCSHNLLTTLKEGPGIVSGDYHCDNNLLKDVYGFPKYFNNDIIIYDNTVVEILNLVPHQKIPAFIKWLSEYDVIREGNKIVEQRLEEAYFMATKKEPMRTGKGFKNYTLI